MSPTAKSNIKILTENMNNAPISVAAVICTYKREGYVNKNLVLLTKFCQNHIKHVYVIDNGSSLPLTLNSNFITIIKNQNSGGSGGFARGMYEVIKTKAYTHLFLMDDDIDFSPETINNGISELKNLNHDTWYSFPMCFAEYPDKYREICGFWNGINVRLNYKNKKIKNIQHFRKKYNYASWFSLIIPVSAIQTNGLPLPFFIKFDDIEYGLRSQNKITFNPNLIIYHQNINEKNKKYIEYYSIRNSFITNCLHTKFASIKNATRYMLKFITFFLKIDSERIFYLNEGAKDFLLGPSLLINNDLIAKHSELLSKPKNNLKLLKYFLLSWLIIVKLLFLTPSRKKQYKDNFKFLTSYDFWKKYFTYDGKKL